MELHHGNMDRTQPAPRWRLAVPREHGAWVMLLCSLACGLHAGRPVSGWSGAAAAGLVVGSFVLQESWRKRTTGRPTPALVGDAAAVLVAGASLLWSRPSLGLAWPVLAGAVLWQAQAGRARGSVAVQMMGVLGFALAAPLAGAAGRLSAADGLRLWATIALYYAGAVTNVRMLLTTPRRRRDDGRWLGQPAVRHNLAMGLIMLVVALTTAGARPAMALAWLAALCRIGAGLYWLRHPPALKRVGLWETGWTLWFSAWLAAGS